MLHGPRGVHAEPADRLWRTATHAPSYNQITTTVIITLAEFATALINRSSESRHYELHNNSSAIAEMVAPCCTSRIFAFEWWGPLSEENIFSFSNLSKYIAKIHTGLLYCRKLDSLCYIFVADYMGLT